MAVKKKDSASVEVQTEQAYEKAQLIASAKFAKRRDLISSLLEDGKKYTISQVEALIAEFDNRIFTERTGD